MAAAIRFEQVEQMLQQVISFDTVSSKSNLALINFVEQQLGRFGCEFQQFTSPDGEKANLWATIGPDVEGGIVLSGHTDVVPVTGQPWDTDPFTLTKKDGRYYGRGTCDMKSFIALALAYLPAMHDAPLKRPLHFAFSYDEEIGCTGCRDMVEFAGARFPRPSMVIVGEPTEMAVVDAHKGINTFRVTVTGLEAHSSRTHEGVNAIMVAAQLLGFIDQIRIELEAKQDPSGRFDPPFTSTHVGVIEGGTAQNIIPRECRFTFEFRELPGEDVAALVQRIRHHCDTVLEPAMRAKAQAAGADPSSVGLLIEKGVTVPPLAAGPGKDALPNLMQLAQVNETHAVGYGTEAGHFQTKGLPTFVCGPGSIAQAHKPNEFVSEDQLRQGAAFFERLIDLMCEA